MTAKSWVPPYFDGQRLTWKDGVVVYNISESLTEDERYVIVIDILHVTIMPFIDRKYSSESQAVMCMPSLESRDVGFKLQH